MPEVIFLLVSSVLDIFIVTIMIYFVLKLLIKNDKNIAILLGIIAVLILWAISAIAQLYVTSIILQNIFSWSVVIFVILFKDEIKSYLETLGKGNFFSNKRENIGLSFVDSLSNAVFNLASNKVGALITIRRSDSLSKYTHSSTELDARFSSGLLESIFQKDSPIHDGATIIYNDKITYAAVYYPIAIDADIDKSYGTRHRAAYTISKETDSISIVVSEETGKVSIVDNGKIHKDVDATFFKEMIKEKSNQEIT